MRHERILKRDDGSKVKITVLLTIDYSNCWWSVCVETCSPGKRKWIDTHDGDDYRYRGLSMKDREEYKLNKQLLHVTKQEIHDTKVELIKMIPV